MTYWDLLKQMRNFTIEQLASTVLVEVGANELFPNECYAASLRICDTEHDSLDENHPVIYVE